jgi:7,8-dihydropterin-6-yl-methyl-4-(beta-D-ribofuranosyl)aminobenzene 5'-phosphate synthase
MSITISVLLENRLSYSAKKLLHAKAGLSLFIQDENDSILFDTGPDDSFRHNAALMGIDLTNLTAAVLSHGHYDHCGGVPWLPEKCRIICHPLVTSERYSAIRFSGYTARIKKLSLIMTIPVITWNTAALRFELENALCGQARSQ